MSASAIPARPRTAAALLMVLLVGLLTIGAGTILGLTLLARSAPERAPAADPTGLAVALAPTGFGSQGIRLSVGAAGVVVLMTDLTCPSCQARAEQLAQALRAAAAAGRREVWLDVLYVRHNSTNRLGLAVLERIVAAAPESGLEGYLALSKALAGLADDAPTEEVLRRIRNHMPDHLQEHVRGPAVPSDQALGFLQSRADKNRSDPGYVPALMVDGVATPVCALLAPGAEGVSDQPDQSDPGAGCAATAQAVCRPHGWSQGPIQPRSGAASRARSADASSGIVWLVRSAATRCR